MATIDEELTALDDAVRRLKIEYDVYFGGGAKKPPVETEWRVQSLIKKYSDSQKMNFGQRFRYNSIVQRFSIFNALWQQKLKIREEGYRRPQDALLAIQGLRTEEQHQAEQALKQGSAKPLSDAHSVVCHDPEHDQEKVYELFRAMLDARKMIGQQGAPAKFDSFLAFIKLKTDQIRRDHGCEAVEYRVDVADGRVRLTARAK